ncbi:MAG: FCD domain-containing protein, partial [Paracoccaceae bacterium]|nr:FCD domain-containing protein [Paracoccaceae bacterium]
DVAFHRALVDATGNPVLAFQLAGAVEGMQPLMNMITFTARNRVEIIRLHTQIAESIENQDAKMADQTLVELAAYTNELAQNVFQARAQKS